MAKKYFPLAFPEEIGGFGKGTVYRMIFGEELSAVHYPTAVIYGCSCNLFGVPIIYFGTPEQQAEWDVKFNPMIVELDKLLDTWNLAVHTDDFSTVDLERILEIKNELILFVHDRLQERSQSCL